MRWTEEQLADYQKLSAEIKSSMKKQNNKFHAIQTVFEGIKFGSKKEAKYFRELQVLQKVGEVQFFLRQVPFDLPGKVRHFVDFAVFRTEGVVDFVEIKGRDLPLGKLKRKQVEDLYQIKITVV